MKSSRSEFVAGAFVLTGLLAIGYLAVKVGGGSFAGPRTYAISARFANGGGIAEGGSVEIAGVPIGRVRHVTLSPAFAAIVEMRIDQSIHLPSDTIASIKTAGLIGDKFVSLAPGSESDVIPPGGTIVETESAVDLESLISRFAFGSVHGKEESPVR
jgi:phospholipid/cholesterol/gamma-HCH transport system substrate-binding protein